MAHALGVRVLRVLRRDDLACHVIWDSTDSTSRASAETHTLIALAGVAAQWLYREGTVRAEHVCRDDAMAEKVLRRMEPDPLVEEPWREYLRQRALNRIAAPQRQLLIALLAGFLAGRERTEGRAIHAFLDRERQRGPAMLSDPETTLEERVGIAGNRTFAIPVERLSLGNAVARALRANRIPTLGRLLQHSAGDLRAFLAAEDVDRVVAAMAGRGFELAPAPRASVREVYFSSSWILDREELAAEKVTGRS